jgi:methionine sulfoxide reductase catalytic subunit
MPGACPRALDRARDGKVKQPKTFDIDALLKLRPLEDRVYRHRCVEAWSMVIPWVGYSLSEFIKQCDPAAQREICAVPLLLRPEGGEVGERVDHLLALLRGAAHG